MTVKQLIRELKKLPPETRIKVLNKQGEPDTPSAIIPGQHQIGFLSSMYWVIVS